MAARLAVRFRRPPPSSVGRVTETGHPATWLVAGRILAELHRVHGARGSRLVVVLLSTEGNLDRTKSSELSLFLDGHARLLGVPFLDLQPQFSDAAAGRGARLFLAREEEGAPFVAGHYTAAVVAWWPRRSTRTWRRGVCCPGGNPLPGPPGRPKGRVPTPQGRTPSAYLTP